MYPLPSFCITIVQYQNEEIDIAVIHQLYSDFISFTCTRMYMCVVLCKSITFVDSCNNHCCQDTELFRERKEPYAIPL